MEQRESRDLRAARLALAHPRETEMTGKYGVNWIAQGRRIFPQQKDFAIRTFGMPGGEDSWACASGT
jgi:hypothetical protein